MAIVQATAAFDWAGIKVEVGDLFEDDHILYVKFPSKFTALLSLPTPTTGDAGKVVTVNQAETGYELVAPA